MELVNVTKQEALEFMRYYQHTPKIQGGPLSSLYIKCSQLLYSNADVVALPSGKVLGKAGDYYHLHRGGQR